MGKLLYLTEVLDSQNKGWLVVQNIYGKDFSLPYLSQVKENKSGDFYITTGPNINNILEGKKFRNLYSKYFSSYADVVSNNFDKVILSISHRTITVGGLVVKIEFLENSFTKGEYFILHPIKTLKNINKKYFDEKIGGSRFAETWFPVISDKEKYPASYLHFGTISSGCIVVPYRFSDSSDPVWSEIFKKLMSKINDSILLCNMKVNL